MSSFGFRPELLDDGEALLRADRSGLLRALATAGAQVRRALGVSDEFGVDRLRGDLPPRSVLVAPDASAPYLSSLIGALASSVAPVLDWREDQLPNWAGPADVLLVASANGRHPRLAELVAQADRRGLALAVAAPAGSPVAAAAARHPIADLSHLVAEPPRALWWALATPALQAAGAVGLLGTQDVVGLLEQVADCLDEVAEADRPDSSAFVGPAKLLAAELAESIPVIAGIGPGATVAARRIAGSIQLIGGWTAMAAALPDDVARIGSLLEFAVTERDFFADRTSDPTIGPRLVLVGDDLRHSSPADRGRDGLGEEAGRRAGAALAGLATSRRIGVSRVLVPDAPPLVRFAAATASGDFAATYLALARGVDPSAPRLGELPQ
ncbi:MAG TPA: SIS domain-containing protein [Jatrophihabitans sp.]|nr:SIS domain-containing protein [Jatrophihabitans sp.]